MRLFGCEGGSTGEARGLLQLVDTHLGWHAVELELNLWLGTFPIVQLRFFAFFQKILSAYTRRIDEVHELELAPLIQIYSIWAVRAVHQVVVRWIIVDEEDVAAAAGAVDVPLDGCATGCSRGA